MVLKNSILIVDDNKANIDGLRGILDKQYTVYIAVNGKSALKLLERVKPDIVLLDIIMPDIDGFEVLEQMKKIDGCENIPVIFITGETDRFNEARGLTMGAMDYIRKPYDADIVLIKVRNQIETKMYRDGLEQLVEQRTKELSASREAIIMGMSLLAEGRDKGTGKHIQRIKKYTEILAHQIMKTHPDILTPTLAKEIIIFSPLHDIGKVGVPDAILLKNGRLTAEEFDVIKTHTTLGADVLNKTEKILQDDIDSLRVAVEIAESHHEKYDGTGYPNGLKGENIPISARIVALADVYDALTSKREYKQAFLHTKAKEIILEGDGRTTPEHFDPIVLEAFREVEGIFETFNDSEINE